MAGKDGQEGWVDGEGWEVVGGCGSQKFVVSFSFVIVGVGVGDCWDGRVWIEWGCVGMMMVSV